MAPLSAQRAVTEADLAAFRPRHVGPAVAGGRIHDVEALPGDPSTLYVATASGGLWKSENRGITWTDLWEHMPVGTFGDLAIAPSDPRILYAGTGEQQNRQSTSWGNGVYRSDDAGATWRHLGLEQTRHTGRIRVHPGNPDIVYVAALGNIWRPTPERGVYRSRDGGGSWDRVLHIDEHTGAVDLAIDPSNPDILVSRQPFRAGAGVAALESGPQPPAHRSGSASRAARSARTVPTPSARASRMTADSDRPESAASARSSRYRSGGRRRLTGWDFAAGSQSWRIASSCMTRPRRGFPLRFTVVRPLRGRGNVAMRNTMAVRCVLRNGGPHGESPAQARRMARPSALPLPLRDPFRGLTIDLTAWNPEQNTPDCQKPRVHAGFRESPELLQGLRSRIESVSAASGLCRAPGEASPVLPAARHQPLPNPQQRFHQAAASFDSLRGGGSGGPHLELMSPTSSGVSLVPP